MTNISKFTHNEIIENYNSVKDRILKAAESVDRDPDLITLIVVTKTYSLDSIIPLIDIGHHDFGENRVQEAENKWIPVMQQFPELSLHLIGHLQTNKTKKALQLFSEIHSVDSLKLIKEIEKNAKDINNRCHQYFLEINMANEDQKTGISMEDLPTFQNYINVDSTPRCSGFMCIPPFDEEPSLYFALLNKTSSEYGVTNLSMGMSADFEKAIQFGATHVRVGSEIFGHRQ
tara:strand:+ start:84 stop:776 length:693 start_codon:yes stop_codon:yes gene_type:complete